MRNSVKLLTLLMTFLLALFAASCDSEPAETSAEAEIETTAAVEYNTEPIYNPISALNAPDPFITYDPETEYYYGLYTQGDCVELYRDKHLVDLFIEGDSKIVYSATGANAVWGDIWAPEMHRAPDGLWYIYTSGRITKETGGEKRIFCLASLTSDPFGEWEFKSRPTDGLFAIDPTMYTAPDGTQYMCYSRVDASRGQVLEIAKMINPYTCGRGITIANAELDWELVEPYVGKSAILEGAFFLENNGKLFIIYSANGCWSNHYALGVLEFTGDDLCKASSWTKHSEPLLVMGNEVYGPGHASFFRSPDGSEVWCAHHGMLTSNDTVTPAERYTFVMKVEFDADGNPVMGIPVGYDTPMTPPSGEKK